MDDFVKTTTIPLLEASVSMTKGSWKLRNPNTGADMRATLSATKVVVAVGDQLKVVLALRKASKGAQILHNLR